MKQQEFLDEIKDMISVLCSNGYYVDCVVRKIKNYLKEPKYALFMGEDYYADGGALDFLGWFDTVEQAKKHVKKHDDPADEWAHIADSAKMQVIISAHVTGKSIEWREGS